MKRNRKRNTPKVSLAVWVGSLGSLATLAYFAVYILSVWLADPEVSFTLQGQHLTGKPVFPAKEGMYIFLVSTAQSRSVVVSQIDILFDAAQVSLQPLDEDDPFKLAFSDDSKLPFKLINLEPINLQKGSNKAYGFSYTLKDTSRLIRLTFRAVAKIAETEWGFPLSLFTLSSKICSQNFDLNYFDTSFLQEDKQFDYRTVPIAPKESFTPVGSLVKQMNLLMAKTSKDSAKLLIHKITK